jgi:hypothetical protein
VTAEGGGAYGGTLINCTLTRNSSPYGAGGGMAYATLTNCIAYYNSCQNIPNNSYANFYLGSVNYCCTTGAIVPGYYGVGNITTAPLFVDEANGNLRLQSNSPCINAGTNAVVSGSIDLDGRPRIVGGTVDIGAYEFQPGISDEFIGWLSQFGLPTDGSADAADSDGDKANNWQEWIAGTVPTDAASALRLLNPSPSASGAIITWESVTNRIYFLERSSNLALPPAFSLLTSDLTGQAGTTSYTDTNAIGSGPFFYRVGVQ